MTGRTATVTGSTRVLGLRRAVAPGMIERGGGKMVNSASVLARLARPTTGAYVTGPLQESGEFDAWLRARVPAGRWGDPEGLGGAVVLLSSPASDSDFVNHHLLVLDGGLSAVIECR